MLKFSLKLTFVLFLWLIYLPTITLRDLVIDTKDYEIFEALLKREKEATSNNELQIYTDYIQL